MSSAFELCTVAHLVRPTGRTARDLETLLRVIADLPAASLFQHTCQHRLREQVGRDAPRDDVSTWVDGVVQDHETAERLAFVIGERSSSADEVRAAIVEVLAAVPERARLARDAPEGGEFVFLAAESVMLPTGVHVHDPRELHQALIEADHAVWFLHLIEEPWFHGSEAGLLGWLGGHDAALARRLAADGASGLSLEEVRKRALGRWRRRGLGRRLIEAARRPDDVRRAEARAVMGRLARRARSEDPQ